MIDFPIQVNIFGQKILMHSIMEFLGIFVGARYYWYLRKKNGEKPTSITSLVVLIGATFGAYFGSHILGSLENIPQWKIFPDKLLYFLSNKTIAGGLLGGLIGVELSKKMIGLKESTGDTFVYPLLLAMIVGRLGCFSAGIYEETYGIPSNLPWALDLGDGILRHPVTLYEIVFLIFTWVVIRTIQNKFVLEQGAAFKMFMIFYLIFRFLLDFIKPGWRYFFGLGSIQIACLLGLIYYSRYIFNPEKLKVS